VRVGRGERKRDDQDGEKGRGREGK